MVKSMTGYGRAVETVNGREFTVEVRSVNNRYLDCTVKLPRGLSFGEDAMKQAVKATISRGKVDVFVSVRTEGAQDTTVSLNKPMVEGYLAAMRQMQSECGVGGEITVSMLAGLPEVFLLDKPQVDEEQLLKDFLSVAAKALESFDAMRTTEGAALKNDLYSRGQTILSLVEQVEAGSAQTVEDYRYLCLPADDLRHRGGLHWLERVFSEHTLRHGNTVHIVDTIPGDPPHLREGR